MTRPGIIALYLTVTASFSIRASATVADEAQFFDDLARRAYAARAYEKALEGFLMVHEIAPSPRALYNIAVCADLAGQKDAAFAYYRKYLASDDPDAARRSEAQERMRRLERKLALVQIQTEPAGAEIYVDRKELGEYGVTPSTVVVGSGAHRLLLELPGYEPVSLPFTAELGGTVMLSLTLQAKHGELDVSVTPPNAKLEFLRDNAPTRFEFANGRYRLPIGLYTITASAPGYVPAQTRALVRENDVGTLSLGLAKQPKATGRLLVSSGDIAAVVYLDGRRVAVTPATLPAVEAGEHLVEVRTKSHVERRSVRISSGRATYLEVDWRKVSK